MGAPSAAAAAQHNAPSAAVQHNARAHAQESLPVSPWTEVFVLNRRSLREVASTEREFVINVSSVSLCSHLGVMYLNVSSTSASMHNTTLSDFSFLASFLTPARHQQKRALGLSGGQWITKPAREANGPCRCVTNGTARAVVG